MAGSEAMLKRAVQALGLLLGKAEIGGPSSVALATKSTDLLETLCCNMAALEEAFARDPQWEELSRLRTEISAQARWLHPCSDIPWRFTCHILLLLLCLKRCMVLVAVTYSPPLANPRTSEAAPPLSPDTLSIAQERTVQATLQLVVALGLCPYLLPGVGLPLRSRTEFSALVQEVVSPIDPSGATRNLYATCSVLMEVAQHPSLSTLILTRHLGDLLAALCQLGFCPSRRKSGAAKPQEEALTEEERSSCREALHGLLDRVYQPLVVRELLLLQGGPKQALHPSDHHLAPAPSWLRRLCGQLLSERLLRPDGVQAVVRGILEGAGAGATGGHDAEAAAADWQKCDAVARILSSCPQQSLSLEDYCQKVCPQVLRLLLIQDKLTARQFQRVATTVVLTMARQHPAQAEQHLLRPMLEPLQRCLDLPEVSLPVRTVLVKEEELSQCVESIFKVYVVGNDPLPVLLDSLQHVLGVLFSLWCFTKQNVSFLRTSCQEILLWFLEKSERSMALSTLEGLARLREVPLLLHPLCQFQVASEGGALVCIREVIRDEDEALYQKVTSEQWQLEQLSELLTHCQSSGLSGDLFLRCLKELTHMAGQGASHTEAAPTSHQGPLGQEKDLQSERQLQAMQLVAMLCESISDKLFTDIPQVVEFVAATLQRACASLCWSSVGTVEAQTLSMAMGLVATLVGGAVKLNSADFDALKQLVPLLEDVSRVHPEPIIQELAADLRITICTHGAFSTKAVYSAAQGTLDKSKAEVAGKADLSGDSSRRPRREPFGSGSEAKRCLAADPAKSPVTESDPGEGSLHELLLSVYEPDIPARAAALRRLLRLIELRDPETLKNQEKLLKVFVENLQHEDSFVYLSAIQGVAVLLDAFPGQVLPYLLAQYSGAHSAAHEVWPAETRMKVGEVLMRATRALGDMVFTHRDDLIHAFLRGARDPYGLLRASSLSNLGELCQILHFQLGSVVHEVTSCLVAIVKTDREAEVRRAAVHVVVVLLRGLSMRAVEVLQDVLLELYRLLKFVVRSEQDEAAVLHAQMALEELDEIMRQHLFPCQTLEKKIEILP